MDNELRDKILAEHDVHVMCESPLELLGVCGDSAVGWMAQIVIDRLVEEYVISCQRMG